MKLTESKLRKIIRKIIKEGFAGPLSRSDQKKFETMRRGNSEVLGYKLTGASDTKTDIGLTEQKEVLLKIPIVDKLKVDKILKGKLKLKVGKDYNIAGGPSGTFYLVLDKKTLNKVLDILVSNRIKVSY
jgi:hypothetical protein|tara:strand:- start:34 stop:420 length:387 start_codon:yes stop_codon:yes gene_type:complete